MIQGPPGTAKTLSIVSIAQVMNLEFKRIQFTPDLMPSDISGTEILEQDQVTGHRVTKFVQGPVFCNLIMADEINRTPPKTQASLLEVMQERQVTIGGVTPRVAQTLLCHGDADFDGAGRHLSAAGSAARPVHALDHDELSAGRSGGGSGPAVDQLTESRSPKSD